MEYMEPSVGKALRQARKRRGIDLAEVEATTRIRARFLQALEHEEWDVLPGEAYTRGFIRTYADYLGLDGARLAEQHRREIGAERPGEQLLRVERPRARRPERSRRLSSRAAAVLVSFMLVAILVAVGLSSGGEGPAVVPERQTRADSSRENESARLPPPPKRQPGLSLSLIATAEVWVCLLGASGEPLLDGQILASGAEEGPFRSGSFTVSFGNGEVSMMVNGQQASIPATSSPIGYTIDGDGALRELSEGERPTCT